MEDKLSTLGMRPQAPVDEVEDARLRAKLGAQLFGRDSRAAPQPTIDRFEIEGRLGAGGMGIVYEAWDPRLRRRVALKVVRPDRSSAESRRRLIREARAAAGLKHPNVVTIYEVGESDGAVWIAMETIDGPTIGAWAESGAQDAKQDGNQDGNHDRPGAGPRTREQVVALFLQAGRGLAAAHRQGMVHRDFKPANVLVETGEDGRARARVVDFGLARRAQGELERETQSGDRQPTAAVEDDDTEAGRVTGTPAYMAPEQVLGEPVGPPADQFAFCVSLYEALEGRRPFEGRDLLAILESVEAGAIRPTRRTPRWLAAILRRGLARDPNDRHSSMDELAAAIERGLARPRRLRWAAVGLALVGALVVGALWPDPDPCANVDAIAQDVWNPDTRERTLAWFGDPRSAFRAESARAFVGGVDRWIDRWGAARERACRAAQADGRSDSRVHDLRDACLDRQLRTVDALIRATTHGEAEVRRIARAVRASAELPDIDACANTDSLLREQPIAGGQRARVAARALDHDLAAFEGAFPTTDPAESTPIAADLLARADALGHPPSTARATLADARAKLASGDRAGAVAGFRSAFEAAIRGRSEQVAARAALHAAYAQLEHHDDPADAARWLSSADAFIDALGDPTGLRSDWLDYSGVLAVVEGRFTDAIALHRQALAIRETLPGRAVAVANSRINLAVAHAELRQTDEALAQYELAQAIFAEHLGAHHPAVGNLLNNYAASHLDAGNLDQAIALLERSLAIKAEVFGPEDHRLASTLINLSNARWELGEAERAVADLEQAIRLRERGLGADHPNLSLPLTNLGASYLELDRPAEALVHYDRALEIAVSNWGADHPEAFFPRHGRAKALAELGRGEEARGLFEALIAQFERTELPIAVEAEVLLDAALLTKASDRAQSRAWVERASTLCRPRPGVCDEDDPLGRWDAHRPDSLDQR